MQYYIYRIHRYGRPQRILWTFTNTAAREQLTKLERTNPKAVYEIRLSQ